MLVFLCNLLFYLSPYVAMALYDFSTKTPEYFKHILVNTFSLLLITGASVSFVFLLLLGYPGDPMFGFIPAYLALFYSISVVLCVYVLYKKGHSYYHSLLLGFLIAYVSSFYWELPENIFWQLKRGYHPAIIFVVLGVFPYIWLDKRLGWEKNRRNIFLVILGWMSTTIGVLTMESNVYTTPTGGVYFLFCRVVCLLVLIRIFITNRSSCSESDQPS